MVDSSSPQGPDGKKQAGPGGLIFFAALGVLYGITRFLHKRRLQAGEMAWQKVPPEFSVWIADDAVHCQRRGGSVECVPISDLVKVSVETNDSGPWGYDVWFVLSGTQSRGVTFPLEAAGKDAVLIALKKLPGFEIRGMNSASNATFECWPNPAK
jgi:hypothetical protein